MPDLRLAFRALRASPVFAVVAVLCLAIGIGANTFMFSVANAAYLRRLPFDPRGRLVALHSMPAGTPEREAGQVSWADFEEWRDEASSYSRMGAMRYQQFVVETGDEPARVEGLTMTANLFDMIGAAPAIGRALRADDDRPGAPSVAVVSDEFWRTTLDGDPAVLGRSVRVSGAPHTIVGVMPPRFGFPERHHMWIPVRGDFAGAPRGTRNLVVLGELRDGVTLAGADAELRAIAARQATAWPATNADWTTLVHPIREEFLSEDTDLVTLAALGAVAFVLLIACANVANLLLARAAGRARELAVRTALGATRWRLVRQLLAESLLLALAGGALGLLVAVWGVDWLAAAFPAGELPYWITFDIDRRVLAYTLGISALTGVVFGLLPALRATDLSLTEALKEGARGSGSGVHRSRLRGALVVGEIALSLVLLTGAGLFVRTFANLSHADPGFDIERLLTLRIYLGGERYDDAGARTRTVDEVLRGVAGVQGVASAGASYLIPLSGGLSSSSAEVDGKPVPAERRPRIFWTGTMGDFLPALGIAPVQGRLLTPREQVEGAPLAVINRTMAERIWPGEEALARRFRIARDSGAGEWLTVVGVVPDFATGDLDAPITPTAFLPLSSSGSRIVGFTIRTLGDPAAITGGVRAAIRAVDASVPVYLVRTMTDVHRAAFWEKGLFGKMFSAFGAAALAMAAIGLYGVISYGVSQRTREIGVRMALGAGARDVRALVLGEGVRLTALGVVLGVGGALVTNRAIAALLWGVSPADPLTFAVIAVLLVGVALAASWVPARRAMRLEPVEALRE